MPKLRNRTNTDDEIIDEKLTDDTETTNDDVVTTSQKLTNETDNDICLDEIYRYSVLYNYLCTGIKHSYYAMRPMAYQAFQATNIYLFWIFLHYVSGQMYAYYCTPEDLHGFIVSPFLASSPHCKALRWTLYNGGNAIDNMWIILATWLCSKVIISF